MAKEFADDLAEKLKTLPREHRSRTFLTLELERFRQHIRDVEADEESEMSIGNRINWSFGATLDDNTLLRDIGMPPSHSRGYFYISGNERTRWKSLPIWRRVMETATTSETGRVTKALVRLSIVGGVNTMGELRTALENPRSLQGLSGGARRLLHEGFRLPEPEAE